MNQEIETQIKELVPAELYGVVSEAFRDNLETTKYPLALKFKPDTEITPFIAIFGALHFFEKAYKWWLGDCINFGENKYGEKYAQAIELTGLDGDYLKNISYCARQVKPENRNVNISWSLHLIVSPMVDAEQKKWLEMALVNGYSANQLKQAIRDSRGITTTPDTGGEKEPDKTPDILEPESDQPYQPIYEKSAKDFKSVAEDLLAYVDTIENEQLTEIRMKFAEVLEEYNKVEQK